MAAKIREARAGDGQGLAAMQALLWPDAALEELRHGAEALIQHRFAGTLPCVALVAVNETGALIGFVHVGLRSHADGCDPGRPVGFIEGWFVQESFRGRGIGKALIDAAEAWARRQGCREMASDALIDNQPSHHAHLALGFEVVDRCVHFRKSL